MATSKADQISGNSVMTRNKTQRINLATRNANQGHHPMVTRSMIEKITRDANQGHEMITRSKAKKMKLAEILSSISEDFVFSEILTRLPVKSLLRFKCVDKSWLDLITSKEFVKTHFKNSAKRDDIGERGVTLVTENKNGQGFAISHCLGSFLFTLPYLTVEKFECYRYVTDIHIPRIVGSCNGLVCLVTNREQFAIGNPCTREFRELPPNVITNRLARLTICGFGYDESSNDYKVLARLKTRLPPTPYRTSLYSLKTDSWKTVDDFLGDDIVEGIEYLGGRGAFVNNKLHWMRDKFREIVSFDIGSEAVGVVEPPSFNYRCYEKMDVIRGCLAVISYTKEGSEVWALKEYGMKETWCKVMNVPYYGTLGHYTPFNRTLCISEDGALIADVDRGSSLVIYNPKSKSDIRLKLNVYETSQAAFNIQSLVSPFRHDELE